MGGGRPKTHQGLWTPPPPESTYIIVSLSPLKGARSRMSYRHLPAADFLGSRDGWSFTVAGIRRAHPLRGRKWVALRGFVRTAESDRK